MTISALRPLDARHVSAVATAAAKAPFLRGPGTCSSLGQEDWDYLQDASPSGSEGTPNTGRKQWSPPSHHGFELPEVAMDPMFEDVWEDTVAAVGPLMVSSSPNSKSNRGQAGPPWIVRNLHSILRFAVSWGCSLLGEFWYLSFAFCNGNGRYSKVSPKLRLKGTRKRARSRDLEKMCG
jgi:hypothetical protein